MRNSLCICDICALLRAFPPPSIRVFLAGQLRDRMETNDLARAISHFDEASVLALLKQARAC